MTSPTLRVAIVGAGPAGIYAGNILANSVTAEGGTVAIDLFDSLPAPYGLIRYGVAPDHPRIKGIVNSLHEMLDAGTIRFIGNVEVGRDIAIDDLQERYDAVILATGAIRDAALEIPGIDLPGSYGAADFVAWFDGHPDVPREWPLEAAEVAVIGNGNVALDVARVLAKHAVDLRSTEVPDNVLAGLEASAVTDVHVFGRRGPLDVKFTPIELRELGEVPDVDIVLADEDFAELELAAGSSNQLKVILRTFQAWRTRGTTGASRRLHLHFWHAPVAVLGDERVEGLRFERTAVDAEGIVRGTGELRDIPVQAVYRAVGYYGTPVVDAPFDTARGVIPNVEGRVVDGEPRRSRACTRPDGSSADRSVSSGTPSPMPWRRSPTWSPTRRPACSRRPPCRAMSSSCSKSATSRTRPGTAGWPSTPTSANSAPRTCTRASG